MEDFIEAKEEPSVILEEREEKPQGLETERRKIRADITEVSEQVLVRAEETVARRPFCGCS